MDTDIESDTELAPPELTILGLLLVSLFFGSINSLWLLRLRVNLALPLEEEEVVELSVAGGVAAGVDDLLIIVTLIFGPTSKGLVPFSDSSVVVVFGLSVSSGSVDASPCSPPFFLLKEQEFVLFGCLVLPFLPSPLEHHLHKKRTRVLLLCLVKL